MLNLVRRLYNFPFGFLGLIKLRLPSLLMVATESLKDSFTGCLIIISIVVPFTALLLQRNLLVISLLNLLRVLLPGRHTILPAAICHQEDWRP